MEALQDPTQMVHQRQESCRQEQINLLLKIREAIPLSALLGHLLTTEEEKPIEQHRDDVGPCPMQTWSRELLVSGGGRCLARPALILQLQARPGRQWRAPGAVLVKCFQEGRRKRRRAPRGKEVERRMLVPACDRPRSSAHLHLASNQGEHL